MRALVREAYSNSMNNELQRAYFAAGCFWGVEDAFSKVPGVESTRVGYSGGDAVNPTYEEVCGGGTGHAETTEVVFDPSEVSFEDLARTFFSIHNPTTLNRQGADIGSQYRSMILYIDEEQREIAERVKDELEKEKRFEEKIVTEITPFDVFYPAEEYHQQYAEKQRAMRE